MSVQISKEARERHARWCDHSSRKAMEADGRRAAQDYDLGGAQATLERVLQDRRFARLPRELRIEIERVFLLVGGEA